MSFVEVNITLKLQIQHSLHLSGIQHFLVHTNLCNEMILQIHELAVTDNCASHALEKKQS